MPRIRETAFGLLLVSIAATCWGSESDGKSLALVSGTKVRVAITQRTKLEAEEPIQGRFMEPIYLENQLAVPAGSLLQGNIVSVHPAPHSKRLDAKFDSNFTPLNAKAANGKSWVNQLPQPRGPLHGRRLMVFSQVEANRLRFTCGS
jgi:hypothetical protein